MKKIKMICMALLAIVCLASCRGPAGRDGRDGNANVVSSTLTVRSSDWYWQPCYDNTDAYGSWRVDIDYDAITNNIYDFGAVLVYMEVDRTWRQVPMTYFYEDVVDENICQFASTLEVSYYNKGVSIFWTESDLMNIGAPAEHRFKIVAIEAAYYNAHRNIDYSNYEQVKEVLQLAD